MKDQKSPRQIFKELENKYPGLTPHQFGNLCMRIDIAAPDPTGGVMIQLELPLESEPTKVKPTTFMRDADYSALEARVYAEMAKDGRLSEYLEQHHSKPEQLELPVDPCGSQP